MPIFEIYLISENDNIKISSVEADYIEVTPSSTVLRTYSDKINGHHAIVCVVPMNLLVKMKDMDNKKLHY
jgi:hypothetical protein